MSIAIRPSSIVATLAQGISKLRSAVAHTIAKGIGRLLQRTNNQPPPLRSYPNAPRFGQRFAARVAPGTALHGYRILGDKAKGVEPGFTARKDWKANDDNSLLQPGHPFNQRALQWLNDQLMGEMALGHEPGAKAPVDRELLMAAFQLGASMLPRTLELDTESSRKLDEILDAPVDRSLADLSEGLTGEFKNTLLQSALKQIIKFQDSSDSFGQLSRGIKEEVMSNEPVFTAKHYLKLDYYESDKLLGKYTLPSDKTKSGGFGKLGKFFHRMAKFQTPREINRGAVNEKLANDLMGKMGMKTQTLDIVRGSYADGKTKLMLDSTHIEGFSDFDGKNHAAKGNIYIQDGVLVKNTPNENDPNVFDGPPRLYTDIGNIGKNKIMMLLLADRDALGSAGGNKGYVESGGKSEFFAIDPGHALEETLLSKRGDVKSDFSFDRASAIKSKDYKNFSIFDQCTFAEKMEGVRHLQKLKESGEDISLFHQYSEEYDGGDFKDKDIDFADDIKKTRDLYIGRRDDILKTFENRLAVDDFIFGAGIDEDPVKRSTRRDQTLNLLDGLEKLTSITVGTANGKKDGIRLEIPQVQKPEHRKTWNVQQKGDRIEFTFQGKSAEAAKMLKNLEAYKARETVPSTAYEIIPGPDGLLTVSVNKTDIAQAQEALSYENIMAHKHR